MRQLKNGLKKLEGEIDRLLMLGTLSTLKCSPEAQVLSCRASKSAYLITQPLREMKALVKKAFRRGCSVDTLDNQKDLLKATNKLIKQSKKLI